MNFALLLAAGQGTRFAGEEKKQFVKIAGQPLLFYSLRAFEKASKVNGYGVLVPESDLDKTAELLNRMELSKLQFIVAGGASRRLSVKNGLLELEKLNAISPRAVLVHDTARPALSVKLVQRLCDSLQSAAPEVVGVIPTVKPRDTIKAVDPNRQDRVLKTLNRNYLRLVQTPQIFLFNQLAEAHFSWERDGEPTDDSTMVERLGEKILTIQGERTNIKLTYPEDLERIKLYFRRTGQGAEKC